MMRNNMKLTAQIEKEIDRHNTAMDRILSQLKQKILDLPDNPRINRINSKCFTMKFSDLNNNWTPVHHDFKAQYCHIVDLIERAETKNKTNVVKNAVKKGTILVKGQYVDAPSYFSLNLYEFRDTGEPRYTIRLHPDVRNHLAELFGMTKNEAGEWQ